jgi:hypothetical protein
MGKPERAQQEQRPCTKISSKERRVGVAAVLGCDRRGGKTSDGERLGVAG